MQCHHAVTSKLLKINRSACVYLPPADKWARQLGENIENKADYETIVGHSRVERQILASAATQVCGKRIKKKEKRRETYFTLPIVCRTQKTYCLYANVLKNKMTTFSYKFGCS